MLSGYAPHIREAKPLAFLRAFTDDSASETGDRRLFFAGFVHRAEQWALFSEVWDAELKKAPRIDYLKMSEAQNLKDQFRGWERSDCDAKLLALAQIIHRFRPISFQFSIDRQKFGIVSGLTRYAASTGGNIPIEFIFDSQDGVDIDVQIWFEAMKESLPRNVRKLISGTPSFRSDLQLVQIQAADMLAWHLRREHEDRDEDLHILKLLRRSNEHLLCGEIPESMMIKWADHHTKLPQVDFLKTKPQWKKFKREMAQLLSSGFIPPRGTRWKNFIYYARERLARLVGR